MKVKVREGQAEAVVCAKAGREREAGGTTGSSFGWNLKDCRESSKQEGLRVGQGQPVNSLAYAGGHHITSVYSSEC